MLKAEVIAFHGWGFDASCWEVWRKVFPKTTSFATCERGYFGKSRHTPVFTAKEEAAKVIMCHSFGFHLCPDNLFQKADLLIIFNGFLYFHPVAAQYNRRSRLILKQMMNQLKSNPEKVLKEFYANTYRPQEPADFPDQEPDRKLLINDLKALDTHTVEAALLKRADKICILHGFEDAIVHRRKGRSLYDNVTRQAKYFEIKNAGHALPFTHQDQCWHFIEPELKKIIS